MIEHICESIGTVATERRFPDASHNNPRKREYPIVLERGKDNLFWTHRTSGRNVTSTIPIRFCPYCRLELPVLSIAKETDPRYVGAGFEG